MEGSSVRAAVRLGFSFEFLDDLHLFDVNYTNRVVVCVRGIELLEFRNVFHSLDAGCVGYDCDDSVGPQVDHISLFSGKVRGDQVVIVLINRQIVKPLSRWAWQVKRGNLLQSRPRLAESGCANSQKESDSEQQNTLS